MVSMILNYAYPPSHLAYRYFFLLKVYINLSWYMQFLSVIRVLGNSSSLNVHMIFLYIPTLELEPEYIPAGTYTTSSVKNTNSQ